jgi:hypothetical protein
MSYSLQDFCQDARASLEADNGSGGRDQVRRHLEKLLVDDDFVEEFLGNDREEGMKTVYQDPDYDFVVLTYRMSDPRTSPPHDHGTSWAIYGQVGEYTDIKEYERTDGGEGVGHAELAQTRDYRLNPGSAGLYDVGVIHSIDYPSGARFVRVTGKDLDYEPRIRYDMNSSEAIEISSATVKN